MAWDPAQYLRFESERARPFHDLVGRIAVAAPAHVVDLGCGPGNATATLLDRWPDATVLGIDSSAEMIAKATEFSGPRLSFAETAIEDWQPGGPVDIIVSNAALHWVPTHLDLLAGWVGVLTRGGALAFQVPSNVDGTAAGVFRTVAARLRWSDRLAPVTASWGPAQSGGVRPATEYLDRLASLVLQSRFHVELPPVLDEWSPVPGPGVTKSDLCGGRQRVAHRNYGYVIRGGRGMLSSLWNETNTTRPRRPA